MKYARLTKEQFESLAQEFINFLATQTITAEEWDKIKSGNPEIAGQELDIFSDLVWEGVLNNVKYLENSSAQQLFIFQIGETRMKLIVVKTENASINITTAEGFQWLQQNLGSDEVSVHTASKPFSKERNLEIFEMIQQGAVITNGELFDTFKKILD